MIVANRSLERAQELASEFNGFAIGARCARRASARSRHRHQLDREPDARHHATTPCALALRARRRKPMFMVDIAVPRDIEPEVAKLEDIYLFTIDDLQNVVNENLESRRDAARDAASQMIAAEIAQFEQQIKTLDAVPTIRQLRDDAELTARADDSNRRGACSPPGAIRAKSWNFSP